MDTKRFKQAIDDLEKIGNRKTYKINRKEIEFDMNVFYDDTNRCGTAACAIGSLALMPKYQKQGLCITPLFGAISYGSFYEFQAVARFFDISENEAYFFFYPDHYIQPVDKITANTVAGRMKRFLRNGCDMTKTLYKEASLKSMEKYIHRGNRLNTIRKNLYQL